jgi:toxin ParE1/3/4
MARLIWTEPALAHLDEIAEYIALDDARAAARLVNKVFEGGERLERFQNSGKRPAELADTPYREVVVPPCRIFYRVDRELVYILYIMRSERLLRAWLLASRESEL